MDESRLTSALESLELNASQVEALSESDLCTLIGFLDYDARLQERLDANEGRFQSERPIHGSKPGWFFVPDGRDLK